MGEAFDGIDEFCWAAAADSGVPPDEAHDYICMMDIEDWRALEDAWPLRPAGWRESCAYVLGFGPVDRCLPFLLRALFDAEVGVAEEAATGYASQVLEHDLSASVPGPVKARLEHVFAAAGGRHMQEVAELLRRLKAAGGVGTE